MTQVQAADHTTHPSNFRAAAAEVVTDEWWFGFEQEYFFTDPQTGEPLGWEDGTPRPQGEYYCGVGADLHQHHNNCLLYTSDAADEP